MARNIYHVSYGACTPAEPSPGWYVGTDSSMDFDDPAYSDEPAGPFPTRTAAEDWLYEHSLPMAAE